MEKSLQRLWQRLVLDDLYIVEFVAMFRFFVHPQTLLERSREAVQCFAVLGVIGVIYDL